MWERGRWTALCFHDEAVAFAAGHRPCALCRRAAYDAYRAPLGRPDAETLDRRLHDERWDGRRARVHERAWSSLPVGAFIAVEGDAAVVLDDAVVPWSTDGYQRPMVQPSRGTATVLTPPSSLVALAGG